MSKKIKKGKKLWGTDSESPSGDGGEMIYGIEVEKDVKERYEKDNLNEAESRSRR